MNKIYKYQFLAFIVVFFCFFGYKIYEQYRDMQSIEKVIFVESASVSEGALDTQIKKRELFNKLYIDLLSNAILAVILFATAALFIYILIKKIVTSEQKYAKELLQEVDKKTEEIQLYTQELETHNKNLDRTVRHEIEKNEKHQQTLFEQSRMAQMGEMISMIAHQWRQPLGAISSTSIDLSMKLELEPFGIETQEGREEAKKYFRESLSQIDSMVQTLTNTIDDFRNFYKPDKSRELSSVNLPVQKAYSIVESALKADNIEVEQEYRSNTELNLYTNEFMQVILNILQNAKDNFNPKERESAKISIKTFDTPESCVVEIYDNGGGIPKDIIGKVFDPYFSTKNEKNGTGLGLYMSKKIVEEHHNGIITADNIENGASFKIELFAEENV